jgi:hypothetical protein
VRVYLAVLLDRNKPPWPEVGSPNKSRISDEEMARQLVRRRQRTYRSRYGQ